MSLFFNKKIAALLAAGILTSAAYAWQTSGVSNCLPCVLTASSVLAQTKEPAVETGGQTDSDNDATANGSIPSPDAAFDNYFDMLRFAAGFHALKADMITDSALGLGEGERVLQRQHNSGVTSSKLLNLAVKTASMTGDKAALDRLARIADQRKDTALAKLVEVSQSIAGKSRSVSTVGIDVNISELVAYQETNSSVMKAELLGDKERLVEIRESMKNGTMPAGMAKELNGAIESSLESTKGINDAASVENDQLRNLLDNYQDGSRDSNEESQKASVAAGGWRVSYGKKIGIPEYTICALAIAGGPSSSSAYFSTLVNQMVGSITPQLPGIGQDVIKNSIYRALQGKSVVQTGKAGVKGGLVTWNNWKTISAKIPDGTRTKFCETKIKNPFTGAVVKTIKVPCGFEIIYKTISTKVPLPNEHQIYVAYRLGS